MGVDGCVGEHSRQAAQVREHRLQGVRECGFSDTAQCQARQRYAELDRGQELRGVALQRQGDARAGPPKSDELLDARFANADQRELGGDEEAVRQNEERDQAAVNKHPFQHRSPENIRVAWTQKRPRVLAGVELQPLLEL